MQETLEFYKKLQKMLDESINATSTGITAGLPSYHDYRYAVGFVNALTEVKGRMYDELKAMNKDLVEDVHD